MPFSALDKRMTRIQPTYSTSLLQMDLHPIRRSSITLQLRSTAVRSFADFNLQAASMILPRFLPNRYVAQVVTEQRQGTPEAAL
jgi:hypothetical protein